jgi:two-component system copper resistance phosphate regulon response regulator CusR
MAKILLVEDETSVASFINRGLTEEGYEVSLAFTGDEGLRMATSFEFDLLILDIMLPGINGLELCKTIRRKNNKTPILFLTALGTTENVVNGLDTGADDYLVKPFKFIELLARIRSLLRRNENKQPTEEIHDGMLRFADLVLDDYSKTVKRNGQPISLTATEYRLLMVLMKNARRVLSRMDILEHVWDVNFEMGTNVVDVYVNYLRKKIDKNFDTKLIHTVIGMGYVLKEGDEN